MGKSRFAIEGNVCRAVGLCGFATFPEFWRRDKGSGSQSAMKGIQKTGWDFIKKRGRSP